MKNNFCRQDLDSTLPPGPFRPAARLILASASPRRQFLLSTLGISFEVIPANYREPPPRENQQPQDYALELAAAKGNEVAEKNPAAIVIAADTIVVHDNIIMGKPTSKDHALKMLKSLQGSVHQVITAVNISYAASSKQEAFYNITDVEMAEASTDLLKCYINTGEPADKAGAYGIQGLGGFLIKSLSGSYTNVVGLPLSEVWSRLLQIQAIRVSGSVQPLACA
ncbi:Maf family protein [Desulfonatronovibrio magnus]|uniref:Maf family protein n=1 Tax=Desulfonatronovibrio magnus TaxID=698827 RepID=UPI0006980682|nr:Maf family protein [Desulfonatronovibrio magnus]